MVRVGMHFEEEAVGAEGFGGLRHGGYEFAVAPRLAACGFDVMFIITAERHVPVAEENELLSRFRDLSQRGRASIFSTMDALERLAPNLKQEFRRRFKN